MYDISHPFTRDPSVKKTMFPGLCDSTTAKKSTTDVSRYACLVVTKESLWVLWLREVLCGLKKGWWRFGNVKNTQTPCFWSWLNHLKTGWITCCGVECKPHIKSVPACHLQQRLSLWHSYTVGFARLTRAVPSICKQQVLNLYRHIRVTDQINNR